MRLGRTARREGRAGAAWGQSTSLRSTRPWTSACSAPPDMEQPSVAAKRGGRLTAEARTALAPAGRQARTAHKAAAGGHLKGVERGRRRGACGCQRGAGAAQLQPFRIPCGKWSAHRIDPLATSGVKAVSDQSSCTGGAVPYRTLPYFTALYRTTPHYTAPHRTCTTQPARLTTTRYASTLPWLRGSML